MRRLHAIPMVALFGLGCGWNYTPTDNVLPDPNAEGESGTTGPLLPDLGDSEQLAPASYRMDCIDIQRLGDADDTVFQVATLQNTWAGDIKNFKLNIMIDLLSLDEATGEGTMGVRSGVGMGWSDQCSQNETESNAFPLSYESGVTTWVPMVSEGQCAVMSNTGGAGTYNLQLGGTDRVFIYAEDNDGTAFNCSLDAQLPDAIPIYGLSATLTSSEDHSVVAGTLTGCMKRAEALNVCSCLSVCAGNEHPDCPGCPGGAVPLGLLLGGINSTPYCTDLVGEDAFDIELEFTARRLGAVPMSCP